MRTAGALVEALAALTGDYAAGDLPSADELPDAAVRLASREDPRHGGFGRADDAMHTPKFPLVPCCGFCTPS